MTKKLAKKLTNKPVNSSPKCEDRSEAPTMMEPLLISEESKHRPKLNELVFDLIKSATEFRAGLPEGMVEALCDLVRSMNCYYSNKIEGHDTHPIDIERALAEDYSSDKKNRDLQYEARSHIVTQRWIDEGGLKGRSATVAAVLETHRRFEGALPPDLLWVEDTKSGKREPVVPGKFRTSDVRVGMHIPVSPGAIPRCRKSSSFPACPPCINNIISGHRSSRAKGRSPIMRMFCTTVKKNPAIASSARVMMPVRERAHVPMPCNLS